MGARLAGTGLLAVVALAVTATVAGAAETNRRPWRRHRSR